jgi:hypothetical protein
MPGTSRVIACVLASALLAGPALAQPKKPTDKEKAEAGDVVKQAITRSQAGDHEGAVTLYLKAYGIVPLPLLLSNVGSEYQQANKPIEALRYFCMYLKDDPAGTNSTYATSQAKVLQIQLGNKVDDDKKVCDKPAAKEPVIPTGPAGPTGPTTTGPSSKAGPTNTGPTEPVTTGVTGTTGISGGTTHETSGQGSGLKTGGLVVTGIGAVGVGLGIYFGIRAKAISDDISRHTDTSIAWRDDIRAYQDEGQRDEYLQIGGYVGGGALVVTGAILYFVGRSKSAPATEQVSVSPMAGADGGGIVFSGGF